MTPDAFDSDADELRFKNEALKQAIRELLKDYGPKKNVIMAVRMTQDEVDEIEKLL